MTCQVFNSRIFWLYFIITAFFVIIGLKTLITSVDVNMVYIMILWIFNQIILTIVIYNASFNFDNFIIKILFVLLLVLSTVWASEFNNPSHDICIMLSIFILIISLLLFRICCDTFSFCLIVVYLITWFIFTLYFLLF